MKRILAMILVVLISFCFTSCSTEQKAQSSTFIIPSQGGSDESSIAQEPEESATETAEGSDSNNNEETTVTSSTSSSSQSGGSGVASSHASSSQNSTPQGSAGGNVIDTFWDYAESYQYCDPATNQSIYYLFHTPARNTGKSYPLIIFLHGLGSRVDEGNYGTAEELIYSLTNLENESDKYSAYTLIPSTPLPNEGWWTDAQLSAFKNLIYELIHTHKIDPKRIYITGISMGGYTTCRLVDEMPAGTFAAAVPLSGAQNLSNPKQHFNTAFYIYHAQNDNIVPPTCSRNLYNQLKAASHPNANYTEFPGGHHTSPLVSVYGDKSYAFFDWLFAQRLP